jgi:hypothetical protein
MVERPQRSEDDDPGAGEGHRMLADEERAGGQGMSSTSSGW